MGSFNCKNKYLKRENNLLQNKFVKFIAKELRMKEEVLVAIIKLMNGDFDYQQDYEYLNEFI